MSPPSSKVVVSPADISDAYKYHAMLANGPGKDSDSESSIMSEELDSDDFSSEDENEDQSEGDAEEPEDEIILEMRNNLTNERENDQEKLSTFPVFLLNLGTELTLPASGSMRFNGQCSNSKSRNEMWLGAPNLALRDLRKRGLGFLDQIGQLCIQAKIHECKNKKCKETKERMKKIAPVCDWRPFREWALTAMSCQACLTSEQKLTKAHTHIASAVYGLCTILKRSKAKSAKYIRPSLDGPSLENGPERTLVNIATVCNVLSWMMVIQDEIVVHPDDLDGLDRKFLPPTLTLPVIEKAAKDLQQLGICKNRLWNLVTLSERQENDLPDFMQALMLHPESFKHLHGIHEFCTPTKCQRSQIDSTTVGQMHKCQEPLKCQTRTFNVDLLETSLDLGKPTAWSRLKPCLSRPNEAYIAISHVWSDGTGVGVKNAGCVNECLFDYFAQVAERLKCTGIWWDALSIPQESKARSKALNKMHSNYANAKTTVVHDNYLVNFEWKDDGSPCLALVLSSWFTRGWTALELIMSGKVQVLFKDPAGGSKPLIKDLDTEVLATEPGGHTRAHWLISGFIRRLRKPIDELGDLLAILKARSTSWARDRTIIAALLLNVPDCDFTRVEGEITRHILTHLGYIPFECLFHGNVTMADSGPWSWCVPSLDDIRLDLSKKLRGIDKDYDMLVINKKGAITGQWGYRRLYRKEVKRLEPYGENLAVRVKVRTALRHWEECLLLREWDDKPGPVLLVTTVGVTKGGILECRYVGRVMKKRSEQKPDTTPGEGDDDNGGDGDGNGSSGEHKPAEALDEYGNEQIASAASGDGNLQGDVNAAAEDADDSDEESLGSSKLDSDNSSDSSEGSEPDDVGIDDDMDDVDWEMDDIRIGNDVIKNKPAVGKPADNKPADGKPAVDKPTVPAKLVLKTLNKIQSASAPEDEDADGDVDEHADEQDSELESLCADMSSDSSSDSDDESPKDAADASHIKDVSNNTTIDTPWFSQADEYRRSELDLSFEYDQYALEPNDERVRHLYSAINANKKEVIRHLIKNKTDLPAEVKKNLMSILDPEKDNTFKKLKTLGDVYFETGRFADAKLMLTMVVETLGKNTKTRASTERLESLHMLGRISMKEQEPEKARKKFDEVLDLCELKDKKRDAKISEKAKALEAKTASKGPTSQLKHASTFAKNPTSQVKRVPTFSTSSKTNTDSKATPAAKDNSASKANEPNPDQKVTKWHKIELNARADLCLLHAETGDIKAATEKYQEALKSFGKASTSVDAFKNIWGIEIDELDSKKRKEQYEEAEGTYIYALKRLEGERQVGKEHRLTLITVLNLAIVYELRKKYQEAELLYKRAQTGFIKELGEDHILTLSSIHRLAVVSTILEKLDGTDKLYQLVLNGVENRYGPYHKFTFTVMSDFGNHRLAENDPLKAMKMFQRVMRGDGSPYHPYPELSLAALRDKARCYVQQTKLPQAEEAFESALSGLQDISGQTLAACSTAFSLGVLYEGQGELYKAAERFRYCMVKYRELLGESDTETLKATRRLGLVQETIGEISVARDMLQRAYDGYKEIEKSKATKENRESKDFAFTHPDTLEAAHSLGSIYISLGKLNEAEELCSFAYKGLSKGLGPDDLSTLMTSRSLGILYFKQLRLALSKKYLEETLEGLKKKTPHEVDQELTLRVATELGITCARIGKYDEAKELFEQAIAGFTKIGIPKSKPKAEVPLLIAELKLGDLYAEQEIFDLAKKNIQRAHKGFDRILGSKNPNTLEAILSLGKLKNQPSVQAENLLKQALDGFNKEVGPDDMRTLDASASLGYLYMNEPVNLGKAVKFIKQAIDGYKTQPISNHPFMLEAMYRLGVVYKKQGNTAESEKMFKDAIAGFEERFGPDHAVAFRTIMRLRFPTEPVAEFTAPISHCAPPTPALTPNVKTSGPNTTGSTLTGRSLPTHSVYQTKGKPSASDAISKQPTKSPSTKSRRDGDPLPTPLASPEYTSSSKGGNQRRGQPSTSYTSPKYTAPTSDKPHTAYEPSQYTPYTPLSPSNQSESRDKPSASYNSPREISRSPLRVTAKETKSRNNQSSSSSSTTKKYNTNTPLTSTKQGESRDKPSVSYNPPRGTSHSAIPQITTEVTKSYNKQSLSSTNKHYNTNTSTSYNIPPPTHGSPSPLHSRNDFHDEAQSHSLGYTQTQDTRTREPAQWNRRQGTCSACGTRLRHRTDFENHLSSCAGDYFSQGGSQNESGEYSAWRDASAATPEISCPICQAVLWSQDELVNHASEIHPYQYSQYSLSPFAMTASLATLSYATKKLKRKAAGRKGNYEDWENYARCKTCGISFESRNQLFKHVRESGHDESDNEDDTRCRKCGRSFESRNKLFVHLEGWGHEVSDDEGQRFQ